jgi:hypothetical protein
MNLGTSKLANHMECTSAPPAAADAFLWKHLAEPKVTAPVRPGPARVIDITAVSQAQRSFPVGMFNHWPLQALLAVDEPFTGLVVLIDILTRHHRFTHNDNLLQTVAGQIAALLGENDFGCRTTGDEFVIVCPGRDDSEARRRLNTVSEKLWEFQQLGHGTFSILFSWGGVGAPEQPLSQAIASAIQRMNHLNANRRTISLESVNQHRTIV